MKTAYIAIGYACNHKCLFCPCSSNTPRHRIVSTDEVISTVNRALLDPDLQNILLSGGEPTIQPHFFEILQFLAKKPTRVGMLSNADALHDKDLVQKIISIIPPQKLHVTTSIHSHVAENHDRVTNKNGSFSRSILGLSNLVDAGVDVTIKHCITKLNYAEMDTFTDFVYEIFPDNVKLLFCSIDYCGKAGENNSLVAVEFKDSGPHIELALEKVISYRNEARNRHVVVTDTPLCAVDPYYWSFFSCQSKSRLTIYNSPTSHGIQIDVPSDSGTFFKCCKQCKVESICPGTWRTACDLFGEDAVTPF